MFHILASNIFMVVQRKVFIDLFFSLLKSVQYIYSPAPSAVNHLESIPISGATPHFAS